MIWGFAGPEPGVITQNTEVRDIWMRVGGALSILQVCRESRYSFLSLKTENTTDHKTDNGHLLPKEDARETKHPLYHLLFLNYDPRPYGCQAEKWTFVSFDIDRFYFRFHALDCSGAFTETRPDFSEYVQNLVIDEQNLSTRQGLGGGVHGFSKDYMYQLASHFPKLRTFTILQHPHFPAGGARAGIGRRDLQTRTLRRLSK